MGATSEDPAQALLPKLKSVAFRRFAYNCLVRMNAVSYMFDTLWKLNQ